MRGGRRGGAARLNDQAQLDQRQHGAAEPPPSGGGPRQRQRWRSVTAPARMRAGFDLFRRSQPVTGLDRLPSTGLGSVEVEARQGAARQRPTGRGLARLARRRVSWPGASLRGAAPQGLAGTAPRGKSRLVQAGLGLAGSALLVPARSRVAGQRQASHVSARLARLGAAGASRRVSSLHRIAEQCSAWLARRG